jgi:hypothetical protein
MIRKTSGLYRLLVEESMNFQSWISAYLPNEYLILEQHPFSIVYSWLFSEFTVTVSSDLLYVLQKTVSA